MDLVHIILQGPAVRLIGAHFHRDGRVLQLRLHGVFAVALDRDREHQIRLILRHIQRLEDLVLQHTVLSPVGGRLLHRRHILQGGKIVKAQIGIDLVPAVKGRPVIVDGMGRVAVFLQVVGHRLHGLILQAGLEGVLPGSEEPAAHTGKHLELCIGCARAHHRHRQIAGGIRFLQRRPVGHRILRQLQALDHGWINIGLQLDEDHIHIRLRIGGERRRLLLHRPDNIRHRLLAVIGRAADPPVQPGLQEAVGKAVVLVGKGQVGKLV